MLRQPLWTRQHECFVSRCGHASMNASTGWEPQIKQFRLLSMEMLELAQAGAWETVTEWEAKRRVLLDELFQAPLPVEFAPLLKDAVEITLANDAQIQELARTEMNKLSDKLRALRQGRRALSAYHDS
ncbi:MAG TPA: flagellar protein FliT [Candidatus Competibacteraceae bacterium]|nr:flagellar protein FliT [Candidatus Competibacteraceae bacterium]